MLTRQPLHHPLAELGKRLAAWLAAPLVRSAFPIVCALGGAAIALLVLWPHYPRVGAAVAANIIGWTLVYVRRSDAA